MGAKSATREAAQKRTPDPESPADAPSGARGGDGWITWRMEKEEDEMAHGIRGNGKDRYRKCHKRGVSPLRSPSSVVRPDRVSVSAVSSSRGPSLRCKDDARRFVAGGGRGRRRGGEGSEPRGPHIPGG